MDEDEVLHCDRCGVDAKVDEQSRDCVEMAKEEAKSGCVRPQSSRTVENEVGNDTALDFGRNFWQDILSLPDNCVLPGYM